MSTGEEYVAAITARELDRVTRRAFQELALSLVTPGTCIFDFGAGPGMDAKFYADQGRRVIAYDRDPRMRAAFIRRCHGEIERGQIKLCEENYPQFIRERIPALRRQHDIGLVTCNFAPLNLVDDLPELFRALHELTGPGARVLASVLNPWFVGDMVCTWWWTRRLRYWSEGWFPLHAAGTIVMWRSRTNFAAQAMPYFALEAVPRNLPAGADPMQRAAGRGAFTSQYMFLLFARR
jgi:SAM-dependent methyltransferase